MGHAAEHSVIARHRVDTRANLVVGGEDILAGFLIAELRLVGQDRRELLLELLADVDHKRGAHIVVKRGVDNFERTMRSERPILAAARTGFAEKRELRIEN